MRPELVTAIHRHLHTSAATTAAATAALTARTRDNSTSRKQLRPHHSALSQPSYPMLSDPSYVTKHPNRRLSVSVTDLVLSAAVQGAGGSVITAGAGEEAKSEGSVD